jgi:hypothetical protein
MYPTSPSFASPQDKAAKRAVAPWKTDSEIEEELKQEEQSQVRTEPLKQQPASPFIASPQDKAAKRAVAPWKTDSEIE